MVQQVHVLFADAFKVIFALDFHGLGLYPVAVLPVGAVGGNLANVDLRVKVGGERVAVVAAVAVEDVDVVDLVKLVFQSIGGKDAGDARVKAAAQQADDAGLFKALAVGPLPAVLEFCGILRLIVGGVHIVGLGGKAGVHDGQVLIRQGEVEHQVRLDLVDEVHKLVDVVGVHPGGGDFGLGGALELLLQSVALFLGAAGDADFLKDLAVLAAFVDGDRGHASAADD